MIILPKKLYTKNEKIQGSWKTKRRRYKVRRDLRITATFTESYQKPVYKLIEEWFEVMKKYDYQPKLETLVIHSPLTCQKFK